LTYVIILLVVGILLAFLETILPSGGLLGFLAVVSLIGSVVLGFKQSPSTGLIILLVVFIFVPALVLIGLKALPKTLIGRKMILAEPSMDKNSAGKVLIDVENFESLTGKIGITITELRPSGIAEINGKRYSVISEGEMIGPSIEVLVKYVEGNNIIVGRKNV
jgi:membrane-bound serine protease (ClpP class)